VCLGARGGVVMEMVLVLRSMATGLLNVGRSLEFMHVDV